MEQLVFPLLQTTTMLLERWIIRFHFPLRRESVLHSFDWGQRAGPG